MGILSLTKAMQWNTHIVAQQLFRLQCMQREWPAYGHCGPLLHRACLSSWSLSQVVCHSEGYCRSGARSSHAVEVPPPSSLCVMTRWGKWVTKVGVICHQGECSHAAIYGLRICIILLTWPSSQVNSFIFVLSAKWYPRTVKFLITVGVLVKLAFDTRYGISFNKRLVIGCWWRSFLKNILHGFKLSSVSSQGYIIRGLGSQWVTHNRESLFQSLSAPASFLPYRPHHYLPACQFCNQIHHGHGHICPGKYNLID